MVKARDLEVGNYYYACVGSLGLEVRFVDKVRHRRIYKFIVNVGSEIHKPYSVGKFFYLREYELTQVFDNYADFALRMMVIHEANKIAYETALNGNHMYFSGKTVATILP